MCVTTPQGHNDVAVLQKNLESTQLDITAKSRDLELKQITSSDKALELGRIRWIVENLYERTKAKAKNRVVKVGGGGGGVVGVIVVCGDEFKAL